MSPLVLAAVLLAWPCGSPREAAAEQCRKSDDTDAIEADLTQLKGKWYEFASFGMLPVVGPRICHSASFYPADDGSSLAIINDFVIYMNEQPNHNKFRWNVTKEDPDDKTRLTVTMSLQMAEWVQAMFRVIATDYNNFIIISICQFIDEIFNFKAVMILTKQKITDDDVLAKIKAAVKERSISYGKFVQTQQDCDEAAFPHWVEDVGRRDPRLPRAPLPSKASGRPKLYDYIPLPPFDKVSARLAY